MRLQDSSREKADPKRKQKNWNQPAKDAYVDRKAFVLSISSEFKRRI
jgi:hypothetical protein